MTATWSTVDGTAVAGADYVARTGQVVFAPGVSAVTVPVTLLGDWLIEPDETFTIALSIGRIGADTCAVWILPPMVGSEPRRVRSTTALLLAMAVAGTGAKRSADRPRWFEIPRPPPPTGAILAEGQP